MTGLPLPFDNPPAVAGSITSMEAAESVRAELPNRRQRVLDAIRDHGPLTDQEIAKKTGMAENSVRPRRVELARDEKIIEAGTAKTASGRRAVRWAAA